MLDVIIWFFALIGAVSVTFALVSRAGSGTPLERQWRTQFVQLKTVANRVIASRCQPHKNGWHLEYERQFGFAFTGLCGAGGMQQIRDGGRGELPLLSYLLSHLPDHVIEALWENARNKADEAPGQDDARAVLWNLVWVLLGCEQMKRAAQNEGQDKLVAELMTEVGLVVVPGSQKVDNMLVSN